MSLLFNNEKYRSLHKQAKREKRKKVISSNKIPNKISSNVLTSVDELKKIVKSDELKKIANVSTKDEMKKMADAEKRQNSNEKKCNEEFNTLMAQLAENTGFSASCSYNEQQLWKRRRSFIRELMNKLAPFIKKNVPAFKGTATVIVNAFEHLDEYLFTHMDAAKFASIPALHLTKEKDKTVMSGELRDQLQEQLSRIRIEESKSPKSVDGTSPKSFPKDTFFINANSPRLTQDIINLDSDNDNDDCDENQSKEIEMQESYDVNLSEESEDEEDEAATAAKNILLDEDQYCEEDEVVLNENETEHLPIEDQPQSEMVPEYEEGMEVQTENEVGEVQSENEQVQSENEQVQSENEQVQSETFQNHNISPQTTQEILQEYNIVQNDNISEVQNDILGEVQSDNISEVETDNAVHHECVSHLSPFQECAVQQSENESVQQDSFEYMVQPPLPLNFPGYEFEPLPIQQESEQQKDMQQESEPVQQIRENVENMPEFQDPFHQDLRSVHSENSMSVAVAREEVVNDFSSIDGIDGFSIDTANAEEFISDSPHPFPMLEESDLTSLKSKENSPCNTTRPPLTAEEMQALLPHIKYDNEGNIVPTTIITRETIARIREYYMKRSVQGYKSLETLIAQYKNVTYEYHTNEDPQSILMDSIVKNSTSKTVYEVQKPFTSLYTLGTNIPGNQVISALKDATFESRCVEVGITMEKDDEKNNVSMIVLKMKKNT